MKDWIVILTIVYTASILLMVSILSNIEEPPIILDSIYCECIEEVKHISFVQPQDYCFKSVGEYGFYAFKNCIRGFENEEVVKLTETRCITQVCNPSNEVNYTIDSSLSKMCHDCNEVTHIKPTITDLTTSSLGCGPCLCPEMWDEECDEVKE